ncbi:hypothetical protein NUH88_09275 [Nisaea acidiphila]|uniref:Uncharacterized protein n=1 Tax=Nisaea acidiphila TaxID=1862145 RepID=A0A9J7B2J0_9PROT|nr:hypothetical protein [Nisaea acidiphila]UUX51877.1 hypothetical protein NUH88_09275 [Nisaea acidiphila]
MIQTRRIVHKSLVFLKIDIQEALTGEAVEKGIEVLDRYPEYGSGGPVLWDLREADLSRYSTREMVVTNFVLQRYPGRLSAKSASLVADRSAMLLARLWSVYRIEQFPQERRAFLDFEDAVAWLAEGIPAAAETT